MMWSRLCSLLWRGRLSASERHCMFIRRGREVPVQITSKLTVLGTQGAPWPTVRARLDGLAGTRLVGSAVNPPSALCSPQRQGSVRAGRDWGRGKKGIGRMSRTCQFCNGITCNLACHACLTDHGWWESRPVVVPDNIPSKPAPTPEDGC